MVWNSETITNKNCLEGRWKFDLECQEEEKSHEGWLQLPEKLASRPTLNFPEDKTRTNGQFTRQAKVVLKGRHLK